LINKLINKKKQPTAERDGKGGSEREAEHVPRSTWRNGANKKAKMTTKLFEQLAANR